MDKYGSRQFKYSRGSDGSKEASELQSTSTGESDSQAGGAPVGSMVDDYSGLIESRGPGRRSTISATGCSYCGATLNPAFYFCTSCGTPYKDISTVVTASMPRPMGEGELIARKAPRVWTVFWTYVAVLVGVAIVGRLFQESRPDLQLYLNDLAVFVTTCIFAAIYWPSMVVQFRRIGFNHPAAYWGLLMLVGALAVNLGYHALMSRLMPGEGGRGIVEMLVDSGIGRWTLIVTVCLAPAICEEIAFRGLVQHWLQTAIKPWRALLLASALFAAIHGSIISFPILFLVGMLLGWVKLKTGSLYPSMLIHFLHNWIVIEIALYSV